jgi:hypothetical protein
MRARNSRNNRTSRPRFESGPRNTLTKTADEAVFVLRVRGQKANNFAFVRLERAESCFCSFLEQKQTS